MAFFSRPNLDKVQFKQLPNSVLELSGQTQILTTSGFTLVGDSGNIPIHATGETNNHVLTYDGSVGVIRLMESSSSGGTGKYMYPDKVSCAVGGINLNTCLYNMPIQDILQEILVPTLLPALNSPFNTLSLIPSTSVFEAGSEVVFTANGAYNRGTVNPGYGGPTIRTILPTCYTYVDFNGVVCVSATSLLANSVTYASRKITLGNNTTTLITTHPGGPTPFKSDGTQYFWLNPPTNTIPTTCPAGNVPVASRTVCGVYPWFWGVSNTTPVAGQSLIESAALANKKCVANSGGDIIVDNYGAVGQYIWVATPFGSPIKTKWQGGNDLNNKGDIPFAGGLFATSPTTVGITSPTGSDWNTNVSYRFYISSYGTSVNGYSITYKNS